MEDKITEFVNVYRTALEDEKDTNWVRGEIAYAVHELDKLDKSKKLVEKFLAETGETKVGFYQTKWVYAAFKDVEDKNLPGITWTHYRAAAGTKDPVKWIRDASDNSWTVSELLNAIQNEKLSKDVDVGMACKQCGKSITKEDLIAVTKNRRRKIFCGAACAIEWLKEFTENSQETEKEIDQ